jgi:hypothetical protein
MRTMKCLSHGKRRLAMALASLAPVLGGVVMLASHGVGATATLGARELAGIRGGNDYWCLYTYSCATGCPGGATAQWLGPNYKLCGGFFGPGCIEFNQVLCTHYVYPLANCSPPGGGTPNGSYYQKSCS